MSQLSPAITTRPSSEKRLIRVPARPVLRLPRIPFWAGALTYAVIGSGVIVLFTR